MFSVLRLASAVGLALAIVVLSSSHARAIEPPVKWEPWLEFGGYVGTDDLSRGETNVFLPLLQETDWLLFLEGQGKFFEDDVQEGNIALGFRKTREDWGYGLGGWNLGGWMGWDVRHTDEENTFHQFSLGVEALSDRFDVRLNGYVPGTGPKSSPGLARVRLTGPGIVMVGGEEVPLNGFDGEVGVKVLGGSLFDREQALRIYAGGFYFDDDDAIDAIAGPRVRAEYRIHDVVPGFPGTQLAFEFEFTHDDLRDAAYEGGVRLRIPLGRVKTPRSDLTPLERRMTAGIVRDVDIVTNRSDEEPVFDVLTRTQLTHVVRVRPGDDLQGAIDDADPNTLVIVDGDVRVGNFSLGEGKTLLGGGTLVRLRGADSRTSHGFRAPGMRPNLQAMGGTILSLSEGSHVAGFDIEGGGSATTGIYASGGSSWKAATYNQVTDIDGTGIDFGGGSERVTALYNRVMNVTSTGIRMGGGSNYMRASHNYVENVGSTGIDLGGGSRNMIANGNWVMNVGSTGIDLGGGSRHMQASGNWVENVGSVGIDFGGGSSDVWAIGNTIFDTGSTGLEFGGGSHDLGAIGNSISNVSTGIGFGGNVSMVQVLRNEIAGVGSVGIDFSNSLSDVRIAHNRVSNTDSTGVDLASFGSNVVFTRNVLTNVGAFSSNALVVGSNHSGLAITHNRFRGPIGDDAVDFDANNSGTFASNTFTGDVADDLIDFDGSGNAMVGGNNVNNATMFDLLCEDVGGNDASRILFTGGAHCP